MSKANTPDPVSIAPAIAADPSTRTQHDVGKAGLPTSAAHLSSAKTSPPLAGDILHGADEIAEFLYGDRKSRRKVYHLAGSGQIPFFKLGSNICARKSVLLDWIEAQERGQAIARLPSTDCTEQAIEPGR